MPPSQAPTEAQLSVSTSSMVETAKDRLWEFQLRKENKAILQEIKIAAKDRQKDQAEYERKMKVSSGRIDALEAKLADLERLYKEHAHAREKWMEEAAAFKSSMVNVLAQHLNEEEVRFILAGGSNTALSVPSTPTRSVQLEGGSADPLDTRPIYNEERSCTLNKDNGFRRPPPGPLLGTQPISSNTRRPTTRSKTRAEPPPKPISPNPPILTHESRIPRLCQGNSHMKDYYNNTNALFHSTPNVDNDTRFDTDFVSSFLRGISTKKIREKLVDELRQFHPSRMKKDGWVEILCEWGDIEAGLLRAGLLMNFEKDHANNKRKGRILNEVNPRTMVETDF